MTKDIVVADGLREAIEPLSPTHRRHAQGGRPGVPDRVALAVQRDHGELVAPRKKELAAVGRPHWTDSALR